MIPYIFIEHYELTFWIGVFSFGTFVLSSAMVLAKIINKIREWRQNREYDY